MKYVCLIYFDPSVVFNRSPESNAVLAGVGPYNNELRDSGHYVAGEALTLPSDQADAEDADVQPNQPTAKPRLAEPNQEKPKDKSHDKKSASRASVPATRAPNPAGDAAQPDAPAPQAPDDKPGAEVVRLDRFRKK